MPILVYDFVLGDGTKVKVDGDKIVLIRELSVPMEQLPLELKDEILKRYITVKHGG